jgi:hypothetical protein
VTLLVIVATEEEGTGRVAELFDACDWLVAVVVATVADKDSDVDDEGANVCCDSFKCLPRTMSDTVGRVPLLSSPLEVM